MIKKIKSIKKMAVYENFDWDKSVRDKGNNIAEFKKLNIIYGRNYSGKTTISRILRAMETNFLSDKYHNPEFIVEIEGDGDVTREALRRHTQVIRVFNKDFIRENLRFIEHPDESIKSFAILGDDNNKLEQEIEAKEQELGTEEKGDGLLGDLKGRKSEYVLTETAVRSAQSSLDSKLTDKANKANTGIKHNKLYGDATYNVPKLKADIGKVIDTNYILLDDDKVNKLKLLLKEDPKPVVPEAPGLKLHFVDLSQKVKELVEKKITISEPMQELMDDALLQNWVRSGREYHEGKRSTCGFCGSPLPLDLWEKLDKHFNQQSEELRSAIEHLSDQVKKEIGRVDSLMTFETSAFYSSFTAEIAKLKLAFEATSKKYVGSLSQLKNILEIRLSDIFTPVVYQAIEDVSSQLENIKLEYEALRIQSNNLTNSLREKQQEAKTALRLNEVYTFIVDIKYSDELVKIQDLITEETEAKDKRNKAQLRVDQLKAKISELKAQLKDESKGADRVNRYLNGFFGHDSLCLKAEEGETGYRFEVTRNGKKAHNLSEGECSLVAFCYFMAKLEDVETKDNNPIIWIDDPISSLDVNHIFFVYSLINTEIVKTEKMKQIFISTHSLDFLKYLKRLPGASNNQKSAYFIIERTLSGSIISVMPEYLKRYVTEFNYLFHQIYKCANANTVSDIEHDCYYNFGNNARKFLEAFLYYKYPNAKDKDDKLSRFFGEGDLAASLTDRVNNEYSHLEGVFERSTTPVDVPEMKKTAEYILEKIKENDIDQYNALLESIGEAPIVPPVM